MMSGHGTNPIFFNKKKIGRPENSLPPPPTSDNTSFLPYPPTPTPTPTPQSGRHMCITPKRNNDLIKRSVLTYTLKMVISKEQRKWIKTHNRNLMA